MRHTPYPTRHAQIAGLCIALCGLTAALPAHAEAPMYTDDAGTLGQGSMKIEGVYQPRRQDAWRRADFWRRHRPPSGG